MGTTEMTPTEAAHASAKAVHDLSAAYMLDMDTYAAGAEAGYDGIAFYYGGRGAVLGDVDAAVVTEAFVFFPEASVRTGWDQAGTVESRQECAARFARIGHEWARAHLPEGALDYARLAELAGTVIDAADASDAPVFAGWRELPEPTEVRELVLHRMNALRELRMARHGAEVLAAGIAPVEALMVRTPYMADIFGWPEPRPEPDDELTARWQAAEDATDERFARDLAVLDPEERAEFASLAEAARLAVT
jgi:hypothetical protein